MEMLALQETLQII